MKETRLGYFGYIAPGGRDVQVEWVDLNDPARAVIKRHLVPREEFFNREGSWPKRSVQAILLNEEGKVLVGMRAYGFEGGKWALIGGRSDGEESPQLAVVREILEELMGEKFDHFQNSDWEEIQMYLEKMKRLLGVAHWREILDDREGRTYRGSYFVGNLTAELIEKIKPNREIAEIAFVGPEDLAQHEWAFGHGEILREFFEGVSQE